MNTTGQSRVFISYSHRESGPKWKAALLKALQVFEKHHLLDVWQDGRIRVSSFWDDDIKQAMSNARLAVVLLTKESLESEYILNAEFPFLRERQQHDKLPVFPVVCEECDWRAYDWLRATQAPNESNPLSQLPDAAQDRIFRQLATDIAEEVSRAALAELPKPEQPLPSDCIYLDKFPLTHGSGQREEKLIGREQELALLDLAFAQPHTAIVSLVAWGGVGKTMLVQHWLRRLQREGWFGARRVYAWSFYSQGTKEDRQASEDTFLAHALAWFGVECEPTLHPSEKGRLLADAVARERALLILDGIEPLQYPPGPMGGQLRAPGLQSLLKQLARKSSALNSQPSTLSQALCIVTTREPLTDLADFQRREGAAWGSVLRVDLGNLTDEAGAALLHHAGAKRAGAAEIKADDAELFAASREVDGHALTLNLLGRFLARAHGGDIRRRDIVRFEEADRKEQGGTTFKMLAVFENWFAKSGEFGARQLAILRVLGLFNRPANWECVEALRKPPTIAQLTTPLFHRPRHGFLKWCTKETPIDEVDWNCATSFLADFGLVAQCSDNGVLHPSLDCHPLIREYFAQQLSETLPSSWRLGHQRLYQHLKDSVTDTENPVREGLNPLYQAVFHGCHAGLWKHARIEVYRDRIVRGTGLDGFYNTRKLGAFNDDLQALACFFIKPWRQLRPNFNVQEQAWLRGLAGSSLRAVGRLAEACDAMNASLQAAIKHRAWTHAAVEASNVSELSLVLGHIATASALGRDSVDFADRSNDMSESMSNYGAYAHVLHQKGNEVGAFQWFQMAEELQSKGQPSCPRLYSVQGFYFCEFLLSEAERACWRATLRANPKLELDVTLMILRSIGHDLGPHATVEIVKRRAAESIRVAERNQWLRDIGLDKLTAGRTELYRKLLWRSHVQLPRNLFDDTVAGLRRSGDLTDLPRGLLHRAWLRYEVDDGGGSKADLDEAWDIAERGPMRLHLADIHLHRARLFFRERPYPWKSPQGDLAAAEKLINDCGYHRRDEELADAKRAILGTL